MAKNLTEDAVRDLARDILGLVDSDVARAGVGQLTTFNQLGFAGVADKPDGWYLPNNKAEVALVLETKATRIALGKAQVDEVLKNVRIVQTQYEKVVGVLYNGEDVRVFKGEEEVKTPDKLQHVGYGIEFDREIYALACANMLIHKDGKTNLEQMDTRSEAACEWMQSKPIMSMLILLA